LRAFATARAQDPLARQRLRLVMVGDGPLRAETEQLVRTLQLDDAVWMPGQRADVAAILNAMRVFVLCSLAEGTSCALQEALAAGADVIATRVGANARLLKDGEFGTLIESEDEAALTRAFLARVHLPRTDAERHRTHLHAAENFSLQATVGHYARLFASAAT
jgi:glycosyltransferase involved in cell wall biosynthesis